MGSLSSRLVVAFAFVILLALAASAIGTLFLLRDQQQEAAEERFGRLAEPVTLAVSLLEQAGVDENQLRSAVLDYAESFGVRVLLVDESGQIVADSDLRLQGDAIDSFVDGNVPVTERNGVQFRMVEYSEDGRDLLVFAPAQDSLRLTTNRLLYLQQVVYEMGGSTLPKEEVDRLLQQLLASPDANPTLPLPSLRPLVVVPQEEISSAWHDLVQPFTIAGVVALLFSALVALLISRSISRPLQRITRAAQEMAKGNYDQELELRGADEVGRLAQAFNVMAREVSGSHRTMRDLLANVSHELKTPLTSIQGFSQALEDGAISSPDQYREAGHIINHEAQRMRRLVDDLINLSRLESGQALVEHQPVNLNDLLSHCTRGFEWEVRERGTELNVNLPSLPAVEGDERRLEQVFSNLIDNAVRHAKKGGAVTVRAGAENGSVRVSVHNTDSYIPPEDIPRVFERFFQSDRSRGSGGSGLGLAIASEVVQAHLGSITATSDRDAGTEFVVVLPAKPA